MILQFSFSQEGVYPRGLLAHSSMRLHYTVVKCTTVFSFEITTQHVRWHLSVENVQFPQMENLRSRLTHCQYKLDNAVFSIFVGKSDPANEQCFKWPAKCQIDVVLISWKQKDRHSMTIAQFKKNPFPFFGNFHFCLLFLNILEPGITPG